MPTSRKNVRVTSEAPTGRNQKFFDPNKKVEMTRAQFARKIERGEYTGYHTRNIGGVKTPASNPDKKPGNNLG